MIVPAGRPPSAVALTHLPSECRPIHCPDPNQRPPLCTAGEGARGERGARSSNATELYGNMTEGGGARHRGNATGAHNATLGGGNATREHNGKGHGHSKGAGGAESARGECAHPVGRGGVLTHRQGPKASQSMTIRTCQVEQQFCSRLALSSPCAAACLSNCRQR